MMSHRGHRAVITQAFPYLTEWPARIEPEKPLGEAAWHVRQAHPQLTAKLGHRILVICQMIDVADPQTRFRQARTERIRRHPGIVTPPGEALLQIGRAHV